MSLAVPGVEGLTEVGRGGGGVVYRAWQPDFGRWVAVKIFPPDEDARRLERERIAVGRLSDHPGIVPVLGGGMTGDGRPYLLMSFMDGGSLADRVRARGVLGPAELVAFGTAMASALQVAHDNGVLHRDIKPANILYDRFGTPRLADFGIAHVGDNTFRTEAGSVSGTVAYMAPELFDGKPFTTASDVFSLGATLYYALEGRHLFEPRPQELYAAFLVRRLTAPHGPQFSPAVPGWLRDVVVAATEPDPARRLPTAAAVADALARGAAAAPAAPAPPPPVAPAWGTPAPPPGGAAPVVVHLTGIPPRRWVRPTAVAAAALAVVVAAGVLWSQSPVGPWAAKGAGTSSGPPAGQTVAGLSTGPRVSTTRAAATGTGPAQDPPSDAGTDPAATGRTGAPAVLEAVAAYRKAMGGGNPLTLEMTFYPYPGMGSGGAYALATFPQRAHPAMADSYRYSDGEVASPSPVSSSDDLAPAKRWHLDDVTWPTMEGMLRTTERVCRATMTKAGLTDEPDDFGRKAGISHVWVERDTVFNAGKVVVRVYFTGGARWDGGYVPFTTSGKIMSTQYCQRD